MLNYLYFSELISTMQEQDLRSSINFFYSLPRSPPPSTDDDMGVSPPPFYSDMTEFQRFGLSDYTETSLISSNLGTLITEGILPRSSLAGTRELRILSFLKMALFILKGLQKGRIFHATITYQWRRIVLSVFRLSQYKMKEIGFDSQLPEIMQIFGQYSELCNTSYEWDWKKTSHDQFVVRFAFEVTIRNVVLPACCGELNLSEYDFWMLLRILKHLLGEVQITSSRFLGNVKYGGCLFRDNFLPELNHEEQEMCYDCENAIDTTQQLLIMISQLIQLQEKPNGQHHMISKLLEAGI